MFLLVYLFHFNYYNVLYHYNICTVSNFYRFKQCCHVNANTFDNFYFNISKFFSHAEHKSLSWSNILSVLSLINLLIYEMFILLLNFMGHLSIIICHYYWVTFSEWLLSSNFRYFDGIILFNFIAILLSRYLFWVKSGKIKAQILNNLYIASNE